jgi:hypothetical protein
MGCSKSFTTTTNGIHDFHEINVATRMLRFENYTTQKKSSSKTSVLTGVK